MRTLLARGTVRLTPGQVRYVTPVRPAAASGLVARVYTQVEREFGVLAPPVVLHSPAPAVLAACWAMLRETLVATGGLDRAAKETAAVVVSLGNRCPYCVDVHSAALYGLVDHPEVAAVAGRRSDPVRDPRLRAVAEWAASSGSRATAGDRPPPVPPAHAAELLGVAVAFQYVNRMVSVFLRDSPLPRVPRPARVGLERLAGRLLRPVLRGQRAPGAGTELLPAAPLPADLSWAAGNPVLADAFARAAAAVDAAGGRTVPAEVRRLVTGQLARWTGWAVPGEPPRAPGRSWTAAAVADLPPADRPAGVLALLTALAPYQVDRSTVAGFRAGQPGDAALIELTAWASLAAARRIGSWSQLGPGDR